MKNKIDKRIFDPSGKWLLKALDYLDPKTKLFKLKECLFENPNETLETVVRILMVQFGLSSKDEVFANLAAIKSELEAINRLSQEFDLDAFVPDPELMADWHRQAVEAGLNREAAEAAAKLRARSWIRNLQEKYQPRNQNQLLSVFEKEQGALETETADLHQATKANFLPLRAESEKIIEEGLSDLPPALREKIKTRLTQDLEAGFITPTSVSDFQNTLSSSVQKTVTLTPDQTYRLKERSRQISLQLVEAVEKIAETTKTLRAQLDATTKTPLEIKKIAEEKLARPIPTYSLFHPKAAFSFLKKITIGIVVKPLQLMDKIAGDDLKIAIKRRVPPAGVMIDEFRKILHQGLFAQDVQPREEKAKLEEYQERHPLFTRILQHYHQFSKITGHKEIPISPFLKKGIGQIYQKTIKPIFVRLGRAVLGKGIKKVATWVLTKLGVDLGIMAAGAAAAPVTAGVSLLVAAVIEIGKKILGKVWQKIKSGIIRLVQKPEEALGWVAAGGLALALLPMPFALIGVVPIALGGLSLLSWGAASASAVATGFATTMTAFFTALTTAPVTAPIGLLVVGVIALLATLTFFTVITTAGAFILPIEPKKPVTTYFQVNKSLDRQEIPNDELETNPCVSYAVSVNAQRPIIITSVRDERSVSCTGSVPTVESPINIEHPTDQLTDWTSNPYTLCFNPDFADCRVCNTVTVTANIPEANKTGETTSARQCLKIGAAPENCPEGWPTDHGRITQGPNANYSHQSLEAVDISRTSGFNIFGKNVYASHQGQVIQSESYVCGSGVIKIQGTCDGKSFNSRFVHLETRAVSEGQEVNRGQIIGTVGGMPGVDPCSDAPHLHYEFNGLEMAAPYIPINDDILEGCCLEMPLCPTDCDDLNINW